MEPCSVSDAPFAPVPRPEGGAEFVPVRVLCLGNDLLSDDALGYLVAHRLREDSLPGVEVHFTTETGFALLDYLQRARLQIVVDVVATGKMKPGTMREFREEDLRGVPGESPHYIGLFESLDLGRKLDLPMPEELVILVVEAADCMTIGGAMHPEVEGAVPALLDRIAELSRAI
jgi:hydrogenase maturation protease